MIRVLIALVAMVGGALFLACGGDDDATSTPSPAPTQAPTATVTASPTKAPTATSTAPTPKATPTTNLDVTLREYEVTTDKTSGPAGTFIISIKNEGPAEGHVFMIVQTDLAPDALPVTSTGQFAPSSDAVILANTPFIGTNATDSFRPALEAGKYVFICNNLAEDGQGHYSKGMHAGFTVE